jgi:hypothetical protein
MRKILTTLLLILHLCAIGQVDNDSLQNDSEKLKTDILNKCQIISTTSDSIINISTEENFFEQSFNGTDITILLLKGEIIKISAKSKTKKGLLISEVYYWDKQEIREFQTLEFAEGKSKKGQWRNSKGKPSWEFNTFIDNNEIRAATTNGLTNEPIDKWNYKFAEIGDKLNKGIRKLEHYVEKKIKKTGHGQSH